METNSTDEQIVEGLKSWWQKFGNILITSTIVVSLGVGSFKYWDMIQVNRAKDAAASFESILQFLNRGEKSKAKDLITSIKTDYPSLTYAQLAILLEAHIFVSEGNYSEAEKSLREIIDGGYALDLSGIAAARLARLYLAQNKVQEASIALSSRKSASDDSFVELRGDIAAAEGNSEIARKFYQQALSQAALLGYPTENLSLKINNISVR